MEADAGAREADPETLRPAPALYLNSNKRERG